MFCHSFFFFLTFLPQNPLAPPPRRFKNKDGVRAPLHLFQSEDVLIKVELDLLVSDVDAQLLEGVPLEVLKAEDVKDPDVEAVVPLAGGGVCVEMWRDGVVEEWWRWTGWGVVDQTYSRC